MKKMVVGCLGVLIVSAVAIGSSSTANHEAFALADRVGGGESNSRSFFQFSTSAGDYTLRDDGMGEVTWPKGLRRVFYLKLGAKGRIERIYFLESERDLFLLYEVHDATSEWSYLLRMEQQKTKAKWLTPLPGGDVELPIVQGDLVIIKDMEISKRDGKSLDRINKMSQVFKAITRSSCTSDTSAQRRVRISSESPRRFG